MTQSQSGVVALRNLDENDRLGDYVATDHVARALLALDASRMGSWVHDVEADQVWGDRIVADLLGFHYDTQPWSSADLYNIVHPEDRERVGRAVEEAYSGKVPYYDLELRRMPKDINDPFEEDFWVGGRAQVTERDEDGNPLRVIGVNWDVTPIKKTEQQLRMLAAEMDHRVKNAFSVIRALINIGAESFPESTEFADTLRAQVEAMATAHTLSARIARQQDQARAKVALSDVVNAALAPWLTVAEGSRTSVSITCGANFLLRPSKVAAFAMLIYELSTNATKYGPLGERGGTLRVDISPVPGGNVKIVWEEGAADPKSAKPFPSHIAGFGDTLLAHCANNLDATFRREFTDTGLRVELTMPATL